MAGQEEHIDQRIRKIGERVRELRKEAGYTSAEDFANAHDLNRVQYWRVESGSNITMKTLLRILDIHNLSLSDFFSSVEM